MKFFSLIFLILCISCASKDTPNIFDAPFVLAVDSTNNRLFTLSDKQKLFIFNATTQKKIGTQPIVDSNSNTEIYDLLPTSPAMMAVADVDGVSRLFISGALATTDGNLATNHLLVLDFDGTDLSVATISPLIVEDADSATDDTTHVLGDLKVDASNGRLYVTDATAAILYSSNVADGSEALSPITLTGVPNKMSVDGNHLYIANSSSDTSLNLITVINTDDATTTTIDVGAATRDISVISNDAGTVLLAQRADIETVLVQLVDTTTFASATAINNATDTSDDGEINTSTEISSTIGGLISSKMTDGSIVGYLGLNDGRIVQVTVKSDLTSFTTDHHDTTTEILDGIDSLTSDDIGTLVYFSASGTGDLLFTDVGEIELDAVF